MYMCIYNVIIIQSGFSFQKFKLISEFYFIVDVVETHNPKTTDARKLLQKFKSVDLAEANHEVEKRYHDQILQNNQLTKERYAASVRSSQAAQNPLFKALGG